MKRLQGRLTTITGSSPVGDTAGYAGTSFLAGARAGIPIFVGYFTASIAFGLLAQNSRIPLAEGVLMSMTNFAGASQFLAAGLWGQGAAVWEILVGIALINLRYFLMGASLGRKLEKSTILQRSAVGFGITDETFSVAMISGEKVLTRRFFAGTALVSWSGWVSGTLTGYLFGSILPVSIQAAFAIVLYALFAALLAPALKQGLGWIISAASGALINMGLSWGLGWKPGSALAAAILLGTLAGLPFYREKEAASES